MRNKKAEGGKHKAVRNRGSKNCLLPTAYCLLPARGFTLVELLVTMSLMVLVIGVVVAILGSGMRVWQRVEGEGTRDRWTQIAFEQIRRDFRNGLLFEPIGFEGSYDEFRFPSLIDSTTWDEDTIEEVGRVDYFFDSRRKALCRAQNPYRALRNPRRRETCELVLREVERVRFSYYSFDTRREKYVWSSRWSSEEAPLAVKLELRYTDSSLPQPKEKILIVPIPVAPIRGGGGDDASAA